MSLLQKGEKSIRILKYTLNLWILRYAQYDKQKIFVVCLGLGGLAGFWGGLWIATLALLARNDGKGFEGGILGNLSF